MARGVSRIVEPTAQRLAKGGVTRMDRTVRDAEGGIGRPWESLETLTAMLARGSITPPMWRAGEKFHDEFRLASFDGLFASDPTRIPVRLNTTPVWIDKAGSEAARLAVLSALDALGGVQSPGGSCAWHVLGLETTLKTWALTRGWAGRRIDKMVATGILIADLGILKSHYIL